MTIYQHTCQGTFTAGDQWNVTLHTSSANALAGVHTAWTTAVSNFITGTIGAMWPSDVEATETITNQLSPVNGKNVAQARTAIALTGSGAGGKPSPRDCVLTSLRTNVPTKAGRGRMYWPSVDDSHYTATGRLVQADMQTIATGWASALTALAGTTTPIIFHRKILGFDVIVLVQVPDLAASQRRRTNKDNVVYMSHSV
jgi:hypothetical protein